MLKPNLATDEEIIESIKSGNNPGTFEALYHRVYAKVKGLILKNGGNSEDAEDIFQDAVLTFYRQVKLGKYEHRTEIDGFVYTVSRNLWINKIKANKKNQSLEGMEFDVEEPSSTTDKFFDQERSQIVRKHLQDLGERCMELLIETIYNGLSMKEIAKKLGFSTENAAKTKHYKCKQRLQNRLKDNHELKEMLRSAI